ncbi:MAG: DUF3131 domain-containing protein, partial [Candidatus Omnitrophota bacterium]
MTLHKKHLSNMKQLLGKAVLFFVAACFLGGFPPAGSAASKIQKQKTEEIFVQQIGPAGGEASFDVGRIYDIVPADKPLRVSTQFKVVDDFNAGELKNSLGGAWIINKWEKKKVHLDLKKEDARDIRSGASLWARINLRRKERTTFKTSLEKLDMSAAYYLVFKCRIPPPVPFKGHVRVSLTDWAGKIVERDVTGACLEEGEWNEVVLPTSFFMGIDFNQLKYLSVSVIAPDRNWAGKLGLDEIAFVGGPEVGFESVEDNFVGFPRSITNKNRRRELLATNNDEKLLLEIAKDTWKYFENAADKRSHLISDHFKVGDFPMAATYTSPTNIAMDLMGTVAAKELEIITPDEAARRIRNTLRTLRKLDAWKGFLFNFYETTRLGVSRRFVSSVDNGWLAIALVVVRQ